MDKPKKQYMMSMMTAGEIVNLIEKEMARLGRNITNEEVNQLISNHAIETDQVISVAETPFDGDLITGNLREEGLKIRNINEEIRREEKKKEGQ